MRNFTPAGEYDSMHKVGRKFYWLNEVSIKNIMDIFEKSFVKFWQERVEELENKLSN